MSSRTQTANVRKHASETLTSAREALGQNVEALGEKLTDASTQARDQIRSATETSIRQVEDSWNKIQNGTRTAVDRSTATAGNHPIATAAIAGGVGFLVGALLFRPSRES